MADIEAPIGYAWAAIHLAKAKSKNLHLVQDKALDHAYSGPDAYPLCNTSRNTSWSVSPPLLRGKKQCTKCFYSARKQGLLK